MPLHLSFIGKSEATWSRHLIFSFVQFLSFRISKSNFDLHYKMRASTRPGSQEHVKKVWRNGQHSTYNYKFECSVEPNPFKNVENGVNRGGQTWPMVHILEGWRKYWNKFFSYSWAWAHAVVDRAPVCHLAEPGSNLGKAVFSGFIEIHAILHSMHRCQNWVGRLLVR
jgi:hypothetical protein